MTDETTDPLALSAAASQTVELLRLLRPEDVKCDAGELTGDASVQCKIEDTLLDARTSPSSIAAYCCGDPNECPSWRKSREADWGIGEALADLRVEADARRRQQVRRNMAKAERIARARELLVSPSREGEAFRQRVFKTIRDAEARMQ